MKAITVEISAFYGYGCGGGAYSSEETFIFGVNNKVGDIVAALKKDKKCVDQNVLRAAIDNGHTELQPLWAGIEAKHEDMVARYWLFEADNECIDESLEPYFRDDVKSGLYIPKKSKSFNSERDNYLKWVNSHVNDYFFIAERVGLDLGNVYANMPDLEFSVKKIEDSVLDSRIINICEVTETPKYYFKHVDNLYALFCGEKQCVTPNGNAVFAPTEEIAVRAIECFEEKKKFTMILSVLHQVALFSDFLATNSDISEKEKLKEYWSVNLAKDEFLQFNQRERNKTKLINSYKDILMNWIDGLSLYQLSIVLSFLNRENSIMLAYFVCTNKDEFIEVKNRDKWNDRFCEYMINSTRYKNDTCVSDKSEILAYIICPVSRYF